MVKICIAALDWGILIHSLNLTQALGCIAFNEILQCGWAVTSVNVDVIKE